MKRLRRALYAIFVLVSLMLGIAAGVLWAQTRIGCETVGIERQLWIGESKYESRGWYITGGRANLYFLKMDWAYDYSEIQASGIFDGPLDLNAFRQAAANGVHVFHRRGNTMVNVSLPWDWHGFGWHHQQNSTLAQWNRESGFSVPAWLVIVLGILPAARWGISRALRRRRSMPGMCAQCRYDLRGNVSGVCPECGVSVAVERDE